MANNSLIIGGSSGIGAALVASLAQHGHQVTHLSREPEKGPDVVSARGVRWDALSEPFPRDCLPERLDGLVYCPGSIRLKPFGRLREQELRDDFELNLMGAVRALQASHEALKRSDQASVVLFSTVAVGTGMPFHASVAAAKGAVEGLMRSLAAEWAPEIRVNAIAPTITDTPLASRLLSTEDKQQAAADRHPLKRIGSAKELAEVARWLLTDASLVTGQVVRVDAGLSSLRML
ncbi:MAG: SDR family oxidoreductase [Chromatiaceae bacterium]|nr:SDR family oxidoreductase [Chromatiaceae bacterium]MCF8004734.1 SDR family oxidoreductase [Chromatiaceae bacterium]MCF8014928.1 SDR family oxidoreductase [Chromatiaceae bacterium]